MFTSSTFRFFLAFAVILTISGLSNADETHNATEIINQCSGHPCPSYRVLHKLADDIEERQYNPVNLPSYRSTQCLSYSDARNQGYFHLSMYSVAAQNLERKRLRMGVPVITEAKLVPDDEPRCARIYTTFLYISDAVLPTPNNTNIIIKPLPNNHFYVYSFGGYITKPEDKVLSMRIRLNSRNLCYDSSTYYTAIYQSPRQSTRRNNEIWMPVRPCNSAS